MSEGNRTPEQIARDRIDQMLAEAGWCVQDKEKIDFNRAAGIAVREYPTDSGPADYVLFVDRKPIGVIEAKRPEMGQNINVVAEQTAKYAAAKLKWIKDNQPLALLYESSGELTLFRDERDPKARSREVFWFHQPGTIGEWIPQPRPLRARLQNLPAQFTEGMRKVQVEAISRLEASFMAGRPRALIQMATGAGKTFTAITSIYRLLKYADARRILFLVDTKNLGEQAEQEFMAYLPCDDNRKFTELYNVQRLSSNYIADSSQVVISTIQRLYAILKGDPLDEAAEMENPAEHRIMRKEPLPVEVEPPPSPRKYWTRRCLAKWLLEQLSQDVPILVGIDHGFSFPLRYFEVHHLEPDWPTFLDDFQKHWPTDAEHTYVDFVRDGSRGYGEARSGSNCWRRTTEERAGAKSVFHFDVPGSVAKSTHAGLPWLHYLRQRLGERVHFWPFDGWDIPEGKSTMVEVYPSLWSKSYPRESRTPDQHDAYVAAAWARSSAAIGGDNYPDTGGTCHLHSAIRFVTPDDRHYGREENILANRHEVYEKARLRHLQRWTRYTRNRDPVDLVWLNPDDKDRVNLTHCLREAA